MDQELMKLTITSVILTELLHLECFRALLPPWSTLSDLSRGFVLVLVFLLQEGMIFVRVSLCVQYLHTFRQEMVGWGDGPAGSLICRVPGLFWVLPHFCSKARCCRSGEGLFPILISVLELGLQSQV